MLIYYFDTDRLKTAENSESSFLQNQILNDYAESIPAIFVIRSRNVVEVFNEALYRSSETPIKASLLTALLPYKSIMNGIIPHHNVSVIQLCISVVCLIISVFFKKKSLGEHLYLPIIGIDICMFFLIFRSFGRSLGYVERYGYSGNTDSSVYGLVAMVVMLIASVIIITRIKENVSYL